VAIGAETTLIPHKKAKTLYLTIPSAITSDSAFPFKPGEKVKILIKDKNLS